MVQYHSLIQSKNKINIPNLIEKNFNNFNLKNYDDLTEQYIKYKNPCLFSQSNNNIPINIPPLNFITTEQYENGILVNNQNINIDINKLDSTGIKIYSECKHAEIIIIEGDFIGDLILNIYNKNICNGIYHEANQKKYIIFNLQQKIENIISNSIDLSKIYNIKIIGNYTKLSDNINIYVLGCYTINNKYIYGYVKTNYNDTDIFYKFEIDHPTVALTLYKNEIFNCKFRVMIGNFITDYFDFTNKYGIINFNDIHNLFLKGSQNKYLSNEMNIKSINFSRIDRFYIIFDKDIKDKIIFDQIHYNMIKHGYIAFSN
jgi:hypothetical protein